MISVCFFNCIIVSDVLNAVFPHTLKVSVVCTVFALILRGCSGAQLNDSEICCHAAGQLGGVCSLKLEVNNITIKEKSKTALKAMSGKVQAKRKLNLL